MILPPWALFALAAWLIGFGSFRVVAGLRERRRGGRPRGLLGMSWRRHVVFGVFYLLVGAYVVAMGFGVGIPNVMAPEQPVPLPPEPSEHLLLK